MSSPDSSLFQAQTHKIYFPTLPLHLDVFSRCLKLITPQNELLIFLHKPAPPIAFSQTVGSPRLIPLVYCIPDFSGIPVDSAYKEHPRPDHLSHLHRPIQVQATLVEPPGWAPASAGLT